MTIRLMVYKADKMLFRNPFSFFKRRDELSILNQLTLKLRPVDIR